MPAALDALPSTPVLAVNGGPSASSVLPAAFIHLTGNARPFVHEEMGA